MSDNKQNILARGKPAEYGQEIVKRRYRLTKERVSLKNNIVLDFGCGNGAQIIEFANSGCEIIAIDISYNDLQILQSYLKTHNINNIATVLYNGNQLPIASNCADLIISYEVIEHVQDESAALEEIHRVLKPGGEIIISVPNKGWIFETHGAYLPLLPWNRIPFFSWLPNSIHKKFAKARIYRKRDIIKLLTKNSFEIISTAYITAPLDVIKNLKIKQFFRKVIFKHDTTQYTFLSTAILVHGRKT